MTKKKPQVIIDSKHLKILAAKKEDLKDSLVFICLDEEKYGSIHKAGLRKLTQLIDQIEPSGIYFPITKKMSYHFYDVSEFKNRDVLVTIDGNETDVKEALSELKRALPEAKSIRVVNKNVKLQKAP